MEGGNLLGFVVRGLVMEDALSAVRGAPRSYGRLAGCLWFVVSGLVPTF